MFEEVNMFSRGVYVNNLATITLLRNIFKSYCGEFICYKSKSCCLILVNL